MTIYNKNHESTKLYNHKNIKILHLALNKSKSNTHSVVLKKNK